MGYNQSIYLLTIIFSIFTLSICVAVIIKKKQGMLAVNIATYVFYLIFLYAQYKLNIRVKIFIILLVLITFIGNNYVGFFLDFYHRSKYYDRYLHAFGSFSFSLFFYSILDKIVVPAVNSKIYVSIFIAAIGMALGSLFEIGEFIIDSKSKSNSKHQHGLKDTDYDLISNVIGSAAAGIISMLISL